MRFLSVQVLLPGTGLVGGRGDGDRAARGPAHPQLSTGRAEFEQRPCGLPPNILGTAGGRTVGQPTIELFRTAVSERSAFNERSAFGEPATSSEQLAADRHSAHGRVERFPPIVQLFHAVQAGFALLRAELCAAEFRRFVPAILVRCNAWRFALQWHLPRADYPAIGTVGHIDHSLSRQYQRQILGRD